MSNCLVCVHALACRQRGVGLLQTIWHANTARSANACWCLGLLPHGFKHMLRLHFEMVVECQLGGYLQRGGRLQMLWLHVEVMLKCGGQMHMLRQCGHAASAAAEAEYWMRYG